MTEDRVFRLREVASAAKGRIADDFIDRSVIADFRAEASPAVVLEVVDALTESQREAKSLSDKLVAAEERANWQNMPNRRYPLRGGYEFYINEEWACLRDAAVGEDVGMTASLMKTRFDPDDDRVRVRLVKDDDGLLDDLKQAEATIVAKDAEIAELRKRLANG